MTCARRRRLEREAHDDAVIDCVESAELMGMHMSCADEGECSAPTDCGFFIAALTEVTAFDEALP